LLIRVTCARGSLRERRMGVAKRDYGAAHGLNPQNAVLRQLAANPSTGLQ
jgi:hypothetical protein